MKNCFLLTVHNKYDDLMAHLDIFKYYPFPYHIIIIYSLDPPSEYKQEISKYPNFKVHCDGHYNGPLLSAIEGVKRAHELGMDYICYRNCDDWLFNYKFEEHNFKTMKDHLCAGYNWMNRNSYHDITLNQLYLHVPSFYKTIDDVMPYFRKHTPGFLCEYKMARWVKKTCKNIEKEFYRLPHRENEIGIGWERKDIYEAFITRKLKVPVGFWERLEDNNRFFNMEWQLIGSHDINERLAYWRKLRPFVNYSKALEKDYHFSRFLDAARNNKPWNLPAGQPDPIKPLTQKRPKIISYKIF